MDALVEAALRKWPNVPHCHGWLGLDARGQWFMRDERIQAAGPFPQVKGSVIRHDKLLGFIQRVKSALPGVPVGYVDAYFLFEKHPRITAACDVVMTNCYPFWEACPREQALAYMQSMMQRTRAAAPGKRVLISETGWPDQGTAVGAALPSAVNAMRYFIETQDWARREDIE